jgi:hypothetical protein
MIITGGYNVYAIELENALFSPPGGVDGGCVGKR